MMSKPLHPNVVEFEVYGDYALFSDPITRAGGEKYSYQVPTYEALKGILSSTFWKPTIVWYIDAVRVMNQIQAETKGIRVLKYAEKTPDLLHYTYLRKCNYQVRAHFEWNDNRPDLIQDRNEVKYHQIARRMIKKGGRRDIFLGTRECQGYVEPCVFGEGEGAYDNVQQLDFGLMYHGITYADESGSGGKNDMTANFWHAVMRAGVIQFPRPEECQVKFLRKMGKKQFHWDLQNFSGLKEFEEV